MIDKGIKFVAEAVADIFRWRNRDSRQCRPFAAFQRIWCVHCRRETSRLSIRPATTWQIQIHQHDFRAVLPEELDCVVFLCRCGHKLHIRLELDQKAKALA
jgi:hypothetical protein